MRKSLAVRSCVVQIVYQPANLELSRSLCSGPESSTTQAVRNVGSLPVPQHRGDRPTPVGVVA